MTGMQVTKKTMDRATSILVTPISLLDKLDDVWLRQRTTWLSLTTVSYQYDDWTAHCQNKPVKDAVNGADHGLIPEVVVVDVGLPVNPLRAHLVETRQLVHENHNKS